MERPRRSGGRCRDHQSWPSPADNPKGRVVEILGYEDDFGVDVEIIIRKHHLPHHFPVEVLQEAEQFERTIASTELAHRHDYRALPIVTIDGETARDFDDAVTVRRLPNGNFELQVHIADVAHYVREGSPIDLEARLRGTSVYFPDRAIPMLPMELSTDLCSLRPQVDRLVLSCVMEIDPQGEIVGYTLNEGIIRSAERMTYTNVNLILEGDAGTAAALPQVRGCVRTDARAGADPEPQARAARLDRFRFAGAGDRVRRKRTDEGRHALGAQHCASADRGVHAVGQRVRGQLPGEEADRVAVPHPRKARPQAGVRLRDHRGDVWLFAGRGSAAGEARADEGRSGASSYGEWTPGQDDRAAGRSPHHAAHVSEADAEDCGQAGGAHPVVPDAAFAEAGALLGGERRPLCAGGAGVHAFHFADPALSRPDRAPHSEGCAAGIARTQGRGRIRGRGAGDAQRGSVAVVEAGAAAVSVEEEDWRARTSTRAAAGWADSRRRCCATSRRSRASRSVGPTRPSAS